MGEDNMTTSEELAELVATAYEDRRNAWAAARTSVTEWLKRLCDAALIDGDRTRLDPGHYRIKEQARAYDKLRRKITEDGISITSPADVEVHLHDIVGVKVLCKSPRDQRTIFEAIQELGNLDRMWIDGEPKDYVSLPKDSGYRACHLIVFVPLPWGEPVRVEIQIKTRLQDAWSELTHEDLYKPGAPFRATELHTSLATQMAGLLAQVDAMADSLATDLESSMEEHAAIDPEMTILTTVRVRASGPKYALAVGPDGRQGIVPAVAVREAAGGRGIIRVDYFVHVGDELSVSVRNDDRGLAYYPIGPLPKKGPMLEAANGA